MKMTRKILLLSALIGVCVFAAAQKRGNNPEEIDVSIGVCAGHWQSCQSNSLERLSQEIQQHPEAKVYRVHRTNSWPAWEDMNRYVTTYRREKQELFDDHRGTGMVAQWDQVTDQAIYAVVRTSGRFGDLAHYGCRDIAP
ncbi:MAG: hypothetical protein V4671_12845 [Armatimonadota bacterium]